MIRHITKDLEINSDNSDKEQVKTKYQNNVFSERTTLNNLSLLLIYMAADWDSLCSNTLIKHYY